MAVMVRLRIRPSRRLPGKGSIGCDSCNVEGVKTARLELDMAPQVSPERRRGHDAIGIQVL